MKIRKLVYVENYGCPSNKFDLGIMVAYLNRDGYELTGAPEFADVFLINTCCVKKPTEDRILARLRFLNCLGKPTIIAGCLPKIDLPAIRRAVPDFSAVLDPYSVDKVPSAVREAESGGRNKFFFSEEPKLKLKMLRRRTSAVIDIMQIAEGCLGSCSYCCTRLARGALFSYPSRLIVDQIREAVEEGIKEVWITAQDTGAYGLDFESNLPELLEDVCTIEGSFIIRVGMMNPLHALDMLDQLINAYKDEKVFKFIHLPLQSGNDDVLRRMNRLYTVDGFKEIVEAFRREMPEVTLSTDIICGFPGEDEEAFEDSLEVIAEVEPDVINISKFSPRPGTEAAGMKQLPSQVVKRRSKRMSELSMEVSHKRNQRWLNWVGEVLIDEKGRDDSWIGRNFAYKPTVVHCGENLLGRRVKVCVENAFQTYLEGKVIKF
jgi:threonylcarbamoyladenosine tRNA methylthiotransferase CDKAL1